MKRVLFIAHRVPYPPDKGERVRAFHEIQALAARWRVTLAALAHRPEDFQAAEALARWCERVLVARAGGAPGLARGALALLRGRSVTEGYFGSRALQRAIRDEAAREPFDLVVAYSSGTLPHALAVPAPARVMDLVDVDSIKWASYADASRWPRRWFCRLESRRVARLERRAVEACQAVFLVSPEEARALGAAGDGIGAMGNGVDTAYFTPAARGAAAAPSLVFTGTMDYRPNVDGVRWFVREVWPGLKREVPNLVFTIVGRDPTRDVLRLAEVPGVRVTGAVPDVRPYLREATAAVVPLLIARGIQNKVLEAMAMGRAVIASPGAIEGLEVERGVDLLEAETAEEWRRCIVDLLADAGLRGRLERSARACVVSRYAWDARMRPLVSVCERLMGERPPGPAAAPPSGKGPTV